MLLPHEGCIRRVFHDNTRHARVRKKGSVSSTHSSPRQSYASITRGPEMLATERIFSSAGISGYLPGALDVLREPTQSATACREAAFLSFVGIIIDKPHDPSSDLELIETESFLFIRSPNSVVTRLKPPLSFLFSPALSYFPSVSELHRDVPLGPPQAFIIVQHLRS